MPDIFSLANFSGIRSSVASSSVVKRGQFDEYEQHAPQAWQGFSTLGAGSLVSMPAVESMVLKRWKPVFPGQMRSVCPEIMLKPKDNAAIGQLAARAARIRYRSDVPRPGSFAISL